MSRTIERSDAGATDIGSPAIGGLYSAQHRSSSTVDPCLFVLAR